MVEKLDAQVLRLLNEPATCSSEDADLATALLALLRHQQSDYAGRRDLFALSKRMARLTDGQAPDADVIARLRVVAGEATTAASASTLPAQSDGTVPGIADEPSPVAVSRLLAKPVASRASDVDLADAIVAVLWRQERHYQGGLNLWDVEQWIEAHRRERASIDPRVVVRLASREFLADAHAPGLVAASAGGDADAADGPCDHANARPMLV